MATSKALILSECKVTYAACLQVTGLPAGLGRVGNKREEKDLAIRKKTKSSKSIPAVRGYGKKVYSASTGGGGAPKPHPWLKNSTPTSTDSKQKTKVPIGTCIR